MASAPKKAIRMFTSSPMTWWNAQFANWKAPKSARAITMARGSHLGMPPAPDASRAPGASPVPPPSPLLPAPWSLPSSGVLWVSGVPGVPASAATGQVSPMDQRFEAGTSTAAHTARHTSLASQPSSSAWTTVLPPSSDIT